MIRHLCRTADTSVSFLQSVTWRCRGSRSQPERDRHQLGEQAPVVPPCSSLFHSESEVTPEVARTALRSGLDSGVWTRAVCLVTREERARFHVPRRSRNTKTGTHTKRRVKMNTYLPHVPIAIFLRYPLGHLGSPCYPDRPVVGVNPSFARRGRKAETERQDAQQASSPSGVVDHLPLLLARLSSSSSSSADQANNQTSLLAEQDCHRKATIRVKTLSEKEGERERGK